MKRWISILKGVVDDIGTRNMGLTAAGVAFFAMFSLFPSLAAMIAIFGLAFDPAAVAEQLAPLSEFLPADVFRLINDQIKAIVSAQTDTLSLAGILAILVAFWSARAGVAAMMMGLNVVYREDNRRLVTHYLRALFLTFCLIGLVVIGIAATVVVPVAMAFVPLGGVTAFILNTLQWVVGLAVLLTGIGLLHRYGPNRRRARMPWITPGSLLATLGAVGASMALSIYISYFDAYNETYGSLGAVIALLMWLYLIAFLVLVGASLNAQIELHTRADTTVGPDRPVGERDAYVADTVINTKP